MGWPAGHPIIFCVILSEAKNLAVVLCKVLARDCLNGDLKVVSLRSETKFAGRTFRSTPEGVSLGCKAEGAEVKGKAMTRHADF